MLDRFRHISMSSEVQYGRGLVKTKNLIEPSSIKDVPLLQGAPFLRPNRVPYVGCRRQSALDRLRQAPCRHENPRSLRHLSREHSTWVLCQAVVTSRRRAEVAVSNSSK